MLRTLVKIALSPRRASFKCTTQARPLAILGNGPALAHTLANERAELALCDLLAVNFAANTEEFFALRPQYYVLADPLFFTQLEQPNFRALMENLERVDWPMTLLVAHGARVGLRNPNIRLLRFPMKAVEGPSWFRLMLMRLRLGMPRPRNVLVPALMSGIWLGYKQIYVYGADHSWVKTLSVNERNEVISVQPHFYKEATSELERQRVAYMQIPLHQVLESQAIAFRSYHLVKEYARSCGVEVYNATEGSFIDAFTRKHPQL